MVVPARLPRKKRFAHFFCFEIELHGLTQWCITEHKFSSFDLKRELAADYAYCLQCADIMRSGQLRQKPVGIFRAGAMSRKKDCEQQITGADRGRKGGVCFAAF